MDKDIRSTDYYLSSERLLTFLRSPGMGFISDAFDIQVANDGRRAFFTGTLTESMNSPTVTRICEVDLYTGEIRVLTNGSFSDRQPVLSPCQTVIAFQSDRHCKDDFQVYFLALPSGNVWRAPPVNGLAETVQWSQCGGQLLIGVAGYGADFAGGQGAVASAQNQQADLPAWLPLLNTGDESYRFRRIWVYDYGTNCLAQVSGVDHNIWEFVWSGVNTIVAIVSKEPDEAAWYTASLVRIELDRGTVKELYRPRDQIGGLSANPSGSRLVFVEAICSDRGFYAGHLCLLDSNKEGCQSMLLNKVDITNAVWRSDDCLVAVGIRDSETVLMDIQFAEDEYRVTNTYVCSDFSCGYPYPRVAPLGDKSGNYLIVAEGFQKSPEIVQIKANDYCKIVAFDNGFNDYAKELIGDVMSVRWSSTDGLALQGWLLCPRGEAELGHALIMDIHGGPVWQWHPFWLGRRPHMLLLLQYGYAVFLPNPRGSSGFGRKFVDLVRGDLGGKEAQDLLSGLDHLISMGIVDSRRMGVMGQSHGGFMTSWLITQDSRFSAAIPVSPVTDWYSQHLTSNIPHFDETFLGGKYSHENSHYFQRSPVFFSHQITTPALIVCGSLDRCTPPGQAKEFHNAMVNTQSKSVLVEYPKEGHGVRSLPAVIDFTARVVAWFKSYISTDICPDDNEK